MPLQSACKSNTKKLVRLFFFQCIVSLNYKSIFLTSQRIQVVGSSANVCKSWILILNFNLKKCSPSISIERLLKSSKDWKIATISVPVCVSHMLYFFFPDLDTIKFRMRLFWLHPFWIHYSGGSPIVKSNMLCRIRLKITRYFF